MTHSWASCMLPSQSEEYDEATSAPELLSWAQQVMPPSNPLLQLEMDPIATSYVHHAFEQRL